MNNGFLRAGAGVPKVLPANVDANVTSIIDLIQKANKAQVEILVLPELCITGYTCADLLHNATLLNAIPSAIDKIRSAIPDDMVVIVGAPIVKDNSLYNCAVILNKYSVCGYVPKTYIPDYNEFCERRWFNPAPEQSTPQTTATTGDIFSNKLIFRSHGICFGVEVCEDLWTVIPPSIHAALAGAEVIFNLSASNDIAGKYRYTRDLVAQQSARCLCGYVYASAGYGESSTDLVFDGKLFIAENGNILASNDRWQMDEQLIIADIDIDALRHDRLNTSTFADCRNRNSNCEGFKIIDIDNLIQHPRHGKILHPIARLPFVPSESNRSERCEEIINIQVAGLAKRLQATNCKSLVIGISGGLDSTLALLVAVRTFDKLHLDRKGILGITMPGFGTSQSTHSNALDLMIALGVSMREIPIVDAVRQHFKDIGHDESVTDVTYENSQARERTQILMDVANQTDGMVLGTGDLSELALGWATYNGDHMSMYGINAGVPKTLVKYLTQYFADILEHDNKKAAEILRAVIDTPISPELIPTDNDGAIKQKTEDLVGPYELHDFFLYYTIRFGFTPQRIRLLALQAFEDVYSSEIIDKWLKTFFRRFFNQQFKRSCLPDGPKVGSVGLSPRGDWRMPSDASSALWQNIE